MLTQDHLSYTFQANERNAKEREHQIKVSTMLWERFGKMIQFTWKPIAFMMVSAFGAYLVRAVCDMIIVFYFACFSDLNKHAYFKTLNNHLEEHINHRENIFRHFRGFFSVFSKFSSRQLCSNHFLNFSKISRRIYFDIIVLRKLDVEIAIA
jgi:hypothetical protein